jgi:hypothetical protein
MVGGDPNAQFRDGHFDPRLRAFPQRQQIVRLEPSATVASNRAPRNALRRAEAFLVNADGDTSGDTWPLCMPMNGGTAGSGEISRRRDDEWRWS